MPPIAVMSRTLRFRLVLVLLSSVFFVSPVAAVTITVDTTSDAIAAGSCSLRSAIVAANTNLPSGGCPAGQANAVDFIEFAIPGAGVHTIAPQTPLPSIVQSLRILGYTQPGAMRNTLGPREGTNAVLRIEIDIGALTNGAALSLMNAGANASFIEGLAITSSSHQPCCGQTGISVHNTAFVWIRGNFIGVAPDGVTVKGLSGSGISFGVASSARQISIGSDFGPTLDTEQPEHANLISGNRGHAITGAYTQNTHIRGNYIGTDASGMTALPGGGGIVLENLPVKDVIAHRIAHNVIGGNLSGISLVNSHDVEIIGNHIGVARDGITPLPNTGPVSGIVVSDNVYVTPTLMQNVLIQDNVVANNVWGGIEIRRADAANQVRGIRLERNRVYGNGGPDIDLHNEFASDGRTPNDAGDTDGGANALQNTPTLSSVQPLPGQLAIGWSLATTAAAPVRLEFFHAAGCDSLGPTARTSFLGSVAATTSGGGTASGTVTLETKLTEGWIVATATNSALGNTSEYSDCHAYSSRIFRNGFE
jgi:hypothetical protein